MTTELPSTPLTAEGRRILALRSALSLAEVGSPHAETVTSAEAFEKFLKGGNEELPAGSENEYTAEILLRLIYRLASHMDMNPYFQGTVIDPAQVIEKAIDRVATQRPAGVVFAADVFNTFIVDAQSRINDGRDVQWIISVSSIDGVVTGYDFVPRPAEPTPPRLRRVSDTPQA